MQTAHAQGHLHAQGGITGGGADARHQIQGGGQGGAIRRRRQHQAGVAEIGARGKRIAGGHERGQ